jgi:hypothetical protein
MKMDGLYFAALKYFEFYEKICISNFTTDSFIVLRK